MRKLAILFVLVMLAMVSIVAAQDEEDESFTITILHTNDSYANHEPQSDGIGSVARQATVVNQIREDVSENLLLLSAGDRFTGTLFHQQYRGAEQIDIRPGFR
jgi:5'-nucleotidase / UDP-sugar diphosphatase